MSSHVKWFSGIAFVLVCSLTTSLAIADPFGPLLTIDQAIPRATRERIDARRRMSPVETTPELGVSFIIPNRVSWSWRDSEVQLQTGPTCTAFALTASIENLLEGKVKLSENHLWSMYRQYLPGPAIQAASSHAITLQQYWPIHSQKPYGGYQENANYYLKSSRYLEDSIPQALEALVDGSVVYLSFIVTQDFSQCKVRPSAYSPAIEAGHAVEVVGYDQSERSFIVKNSWGKDCGDRGYQFLPYEYCTRSGMYCVMWAINEAGEMAK